MGKRRTYTDKQRSEALKLYAEDGLSAAHKKTRIPKTTIQSWAKRNGVRTSATQNVREANQAQAENFKARRQRIISDLYDLTEDSVRLLKKPNEYQTITKGTFGVEEASTLGFVPAQDKQREVTAIGILLDKASVLEKFDNDNGATAAKGLLVALAEQIGVASE